MHKARLSSWFIGFLLSSAPCFADSYKIYADLGAGYAAPQSMPNAYSYQLLNGTEVSGTPNRTDETLGGRATLGFLWDAKTALAYGVEAGAAYYGTTKYSTNQSTLNMHYYGIEFLGVAQLNIDLLHLIFKAGVTDEQMQPTKSTMPASQLQDSNTVLPEVGLGLAYSLRPDLQLGLSYYHTFGHNVNFNSNGAAENLPSMNMGLLELTYFVT